MPNRGNRPGGTGKPLTPHVQAIADAWAKKSSVDGPVGLPVHGKFENVRVADMVTDGNTVSIWLEFNQTAQPDFVIVNPPTAIGISPTESIADPLGALAVIIDGASK